MFDVEWMSIKVSKQHYFFYVAENLLISVSEIYQYIKKKIKYNF